VADADGRLSDYIPAMGSLYDTDLYLWSREQAEILRHMARNGNNARVDWENVAEEIESLGKSDRRAVESQLRRIIVHLMKLQASPASDPRAGWHQTVIEARSELEAMLADSPSLKRRVPEFIERQVPQARTQVKTAFDDYGEQPRVALEDLTYTEEQVLGGWLP
jgi:hypothetical protein